MILWGGFTTNFIWCVILNLKNRSAHEYLNLRRSAVGEVSMAEGVMLSAAPEERVRPRDQARPRGSETGPGAADPELHFLGLAGT